MKAWKHTITKKLIDIQTIPNPLPEGYDPEEWQLADVTEGEIASLSKIASYAHSERGVKDLIVETPINITHNLEVLL